MSERPRIAITMGDAAGVGPEVVMKALAHRELYAVARPLVVGDAKRLMRAGRIVDSRLAVRAIAEADEARFEAGAVDCIDLALVPEDAPFGRLSAACGEAAYRFIERAVALARAGQVDAICTAPINKEALNAAGHRFPGHTKDRKTGSSGFCVGGYGRMV
jgi:4-hydroxythreonine-4-phosphate dehydrogenase